MATTEYSLQRVLRDSHAECPILASQLFGQLVAQGQLKVVLARYNAPVQHAVCVAILAARHRAQKIRACIDFLNTCFVAFCTSAR